MIGCIFFNFRLPMHPTSFHYFFLFFKVTVVLFIYSSTCAFFVCAVMELTAGALARSIRYLRATFVLDLKYLLELEGSSHFVLSPMALFGSIAMNQEWERRQSAENHWRKLMEWKDSLSSGSFQQNGSHTLQVNHRVARRSVVPPTC